METYAFDLEVFPNFFSAIFINIENSFDEETFIIYKDRDDSDKIREFINQSIILVGYNNLYFDNVLLNAILESKTNLYKIGQQIINEENRDFISSLRNKRVPYKSIDFKELCGLDISLKQAIIVLEWSKIQELPFPPDKIITDEDVPEILSYNRNDVLPLIKLWEELQPEIKLRERVTELYGLDVTSKSEGQLPNIIFEQLYSKAVAKPIKQIKELRTTRTSIILEECVGKNIWFDSLCLNEFMGKVQGLELISNNGNSFRECLQFAGLAFNLGVGGIHTQDSPGYFYSDNDCQIIDADVTSFYPFIILQNEIKPAHLDYKILEIYKGLVDKKIEAGLAGDKTAESIFKISINAPFGKMGNPDYWFYDMLAFYSVTISGQLYLLSLVEHLTLNGIEVISANTDGVTCRVKKGQEDLYYKSCQKWTDRTEFKLKFTTYQKYIRRDVNNYIVLKNDGKLKRKGIFETKDDISLYRRLMKGYTPDIIPQCLTNYFIYDIPVEETLAKSKNIFDFLMAQRVGKVFEVILRKGLTDEKQQRINRYYVSTDGGILIKKDDKRELSILAGVNVQIANDIDKKRPFEDYKVNLKWYQSEVEKIINQIEISQLVLF